MAKQSTHHTSPTTVVVSTTAGASAAAASLSTSATTAVSTSSSHHHHPHHHHHHHHPHHPHSHQTVIAGPNGQSLVNEMEPSVLDASTFVEVPVNGNIDSLISSSSSCIQSSTNHYQEISFIGSGAYGSVYKARNVHSEDLVALKKVRIPVSDDGVPITLIREIALLKQLESFAHPNVVRLLDICHGNRSIHERQFTLYLVFEHVEQDLATYLELCPSPGLSPDRIKDIMYQIMRGVDFLHSNRIVHRDLKPQNILISNSGEVKLADFGLARIYEQMQTLTTVVVTLWYRSPEVLLKSSYASSVDIWSCGCIFAELHMRRPLFPGTSEVDQLSKIFKILGSPSIDEWPSEVSLSWKFFAGNRKTPFNQIIPEIEDDAQLLLESMLTFDPAKRSSATQILENEYFKDFELYPPAYYNNYTGASNSSYIDHRSSSESTSSTNTFTSSLDTSSASSRSVLDSFIQPSSTSSAASSSSSSARRFNL